MENINMILILFLLLVILFMILTHVNVDFYNYPTTITTNGKCSETKFGCCPDGKNSKINFYGTNCPPYNPGAGYDPTPEPVPQPQPNPYPPVPNPPIPVPPGPQPYYASQTQPQQPYTQSQPYVQSQTSAIPPTPVIYNPPIPNMYEPGPRPPKVAGGIGTQY